MREHFSEGQEVLHGDLNKISTRMEQQLYEGIVNEILGGNTGFFGSGMRVDRDSVSQITVKKGFGIGSNPNPVPGGLKNIPTILHADTTQAINAAHATLDRIDCIWIIPTIRTVETATRDIKDPNSNTVAPQTVVTAETWSGQVAYVAGTPAASPVPPANSGHPLAFKLANVLVKAGTGVENDAAISDQRNLLNNLSDQITSGRIADDAVTTAKINDDAVTGAKIAANAVTVTNIANSSVTTAKINDGAVTNAKIGSNAVTSAKISSGAVTNAKIGANAVTGAKIASGTITGSDIADDTISAGKMLGHNQTFSRTTTNNTLPSSAYETIRSVSITPTRSNAKIFLMGCCYALWSSATTTRQIDLQIVKVGTATALNYQSFLCGGINIRRFPLVIFHVDTISAATTYRLQASKVNSAHYTTVVDNVAFFALQL